jgi:hypothetical protein
MFEKLRVVFSIPELRQKILLTLFLLSVYRIGYHVRLPVLKSDLAGSTSELKSFMEKVAVFSATDLRSLTIFGLGLAPYISASIIFQLLGTVWKPIEDLRKEEGGAQGYAKRLRHGEIGKGLNDYDAIFSELKRKGFDGWISIEDGVDGMEQLERSVAFLRRKIAEHWG